MRCQALCALALLVASGGVVAAAPTTLSYEGRLADAGGTPISVPQNITFRLYDVPTGGSALWTEAQANVAVDGGNLSVELGRSVALPHSLFGRQLYLGIQIAGDSEMQPRPPLTAAPFALRAAGTMKNTLVVSAEGSASENGAALLAAVTSISAATASAPVAVEIDAGVYDLGTAQLLIPSHVTLTGRGESASRIQSANIETTVRLTPQTSLRQLSVVNTGIPASTGIASAISAMDPADNLVTLSGIVIENVNAETNAAFGTPGLRNAIVACLVDSRISRVSAHATGGEYGMGLRNGCRTTNNVTIEQLKVGAAGASLGLRGAYLAGGGLWSGVSANLETHPGLESAYGIRVFSNDVGAAAALLDSTVSIQGNGAPATNPFSRIEGIRVESADIVFRGVNVFVENVDARNIAGLHLQAIPFGPDPLSVFSGNGLNLVVSGRQRASLGFGNIHGIYIVNAAPDLNGAHVFVDCLAGGANGCYGVHRIVDAAGLQAGNMLLNQVAIDIGHRDPADASAQSFGLNARGPVRMTNSSIRLRRSVDGESHAGVIGGNADSDIRVVSSTIEVEDAASANAGCAIGGGAGTGELFNSHIQGNGCTSGLVLTCAGNSKRGAGFLAGACP